MASGATESNTDAQKLSEGQADKKEIAKTADPKGKPLCAACSITFSRNSHLKRHLRTQHGQVFLESPNRGSQCSLWCPLCGQHFTSRLHTENHITAFHQIELCSKSFAFYTEDEFTKWKTALEKQESCSYVSTKGETRLSNGTFAKYYHCHRCGKYQSTVKGERKRRLKLNGTIKIGTYCPARIKRITTVVDGATEINVEYVSTHIGHGKDAETHAKRKHARQQQERRNKDRVLKNLQSTVNRTKRVRKTSKQDVAVEPLQECFEPVEQTIENISSELPVVDTEVPKMTENTAGDSVIYLYQPQCDGVSQWNEYQQRVPQDMVVENSEPEKSLMTVDGLAKRKENFISLLQVAASKVDNASLDHHFDIIDRFAVAIIDHLDGFAIPQPVLNQVVHDDVTYQTLGS